MRHLFGRAAAAAVFAAVCLSLSACSTVRKSGNFERRFPEIQKVVVVPPEFTVIRRVFKGDDETLFEESKDSAEHIHIALEESFRKKGYEVMPYRTVEEAAANDPELVRILNQLKERYAKSAEDIQKLFIDKAEWDDFHFSLGSDVNAVVDAAGADALVFAQGGGFVSSGGEIAKGIAKTTLIAAASLGMVTYIEPDHYAMLYVSVVDGDNGEILWHNPSQSAFAFDPLNPGSLKTMTDGTLNAYPKRAAESPMAETAAQPAVKKAAADPAPLSAAGANVEVTPVSGEVLLEAAERAGIKAMGIAEDVFQFDALIKPRGRQGPVFTDDIKQLYWYCKFTFSRSAKNSWEKGWAKKNARKLKAVWYAPDGTIYHEDIFSWGTMAPEVAKTKVEFSRPFEDRLRGTWRLRVWIGEVLVDDRQFEIAPSIPETPSVPPAERPSAPAVMMPAAERPAAV